MTNTAITDLPDVLTTEDIMRILRISKNSAYRLLKERVIKSVKVLDSYRVRKEDLLNYLKSNSD